MPTDTQRIALLEKQFAQLQQQVRQQSFFKVAEHQQGLVPGELIAGRIRGIAPPGTPGMVLDFTGNMAGSSPLQLVSDGTYNRTQNGNLAAYTDPNGVSSPAGPGMRVLDASGNILFDSIGVVQVMQPASGSPSLIGASSVTALAYALVTGSGVTFTLTRQQRVLVMAEVTAFLSGAAGNFGYSKVFVDGAQHSDIRIWDKAVAGYTNACTIDSAVLSAGSHTIDIRAQVDNAALTLFVNNGRLYVFLLGS